MLENLLNSISDNPAYLAVAIVLITMITFSVIKKLFKIVTLGITLFILYCAYLLFTNQPLPNIDEIKTQLESSEEKIGDVIEDTVLDPLKEKTETIKNYFLSFLFFLSADLVQCLLLHHLFFLRYFQAVF